MLISLSKKFFAILKMFFRAFVLTIFKYVKDGHFSLVSLAICLKFVYEIDVMLMISPVNNLQIFIERFFVKFFEN